VSRTAEKIPASIQGINTAPQAACPVAAPLSVLWIAPESSQCLQVRAAFEKLGIELHRFDWISDWADAAS